MIPNNDVSQYDSTEPEYTLSSVSSITLKAVFKPLAEMDKEAREVTPVVINEVSADNEMFINEYYKKSDWIELYNTSDEDVDVGGMYLSDDTSKTKKYQIPVSNGTVNTIIPAHGFLVVWCDQLDDLTQLHTSFKIDADGGDVLLTASDLSWTNTLNYPQHDGWHSVGRFPDGAENIYMFAMPSINKTNRLIFADNIVYIPTSTKDLTQEVATAYMTVPVGQKELKVDFDKLTEIAQAIEATDLLAGEHYRGLMDDGYWSNPVVANSDRGLTFNEYGFCSSNADITIRFEDDKICTRSEAALDEHWTANALICFQNGLKRYTIHLTLMSEQEYSSGITTIKTPADTSDKVYNIAGQRISSSYRGIHIINGRKVLIKY